MTEVRVSVVAVLLAVFAAVPAVAACTQGTCYVGPCICLVENGDEQFSDTTCSLWQFGGSATRSSSGGDYYGEIASSIGTISQTVDGGNTGNDVELHVDIEIIPSDNPGNEKLYVEVRTTGGSLLETLDILDVNDSGGSLQYNTSGYNVGDVVLRFRRGTGLNDGGSDFRVDNVRWWVCGF
jgi:hypothetical protein